MGTLFAGLSWVPLGLASGVTDSSSWHYAAWLAIDLRLLVVVAVIALLTAVGLCALFVRGRKMVDYAAAFIVSFTVAFALSLWLFNGVADYPVFAVKSLFAFP